MDIIKKDAKANSEGYKRAKTSHYTEYCEDTTANFRQDITQKIELLMNYIRDEANQTQTTVTHEAASSNAISARCSISISIVGVLGEYSMPQNSSAVNDEDDYLI